MATAKKTSRGKKPYTAAEIAQGMASLYYELAWTLTAYRDGPKDGTFHPGPELLTADEALAAAPKLAKSFEADAWLLDSNLLAALETWTGATEARRHLTRDLVFQCTRLVLGKQDVAAFERAVAATRADGFKLSAGKKREIKAVLARKGANDLGRAYRVFRLVSHGANCLPSADDRKAPRGDLRRMIENELRFVATERVTTKRGSRHPER